MSTKINVRSPFYLEIEEPTAPAIELTCDVAELRDFSVDQFGNVVLPNPKYGTIISYTSSDSDFTDGRYATVSTDTLRTVDFTIGIPPTFTNAADDTIVCTLTATQPEFVCTGGVTTNGSIPNQSLDTGGETATIDLTSYFTQGTDPISKYVITNNHPTFVSAYISGTNLIISSSNKAGTENIYVEAQDGDLGTCNATQSVQITITATNAFACADAEMTGGGIAQDGTITNPTLFGNISAIRSTQGGATINSYPANTTGSSRSVTLYFDITVPVGYTNTGGTISECPKTFIQPSTALPEFDCEVAALTTQGIYINGTIKQGTSAKGTISGFSPTSFDTVTSTTPRTVTFNVTPPASGYSNSGGSDIPCVKTLTQPPINISKGEFNWYSDTSTFEFLKLDQYANSEANPQLSYEGVYTNLSGIIQQHDTLYALISDDPTQWIGSTLHYSNIYTVNYAPQVGRRVTWSDGSSRYIMLNKTRRFGLLNYGQGGNDYYIYYTGNIITEVWYWDYGTKTLIQIA